MPSHKIKTSGLFSSKKLLNRSLFYHTSISKLVESIVEGQPVELWAGKNAKMF
jgi:hypothetical protein